VLTFAWWLLASIHLLASAAWFGAMVYNLTLLHPRARKFFAPDDEKFEEFIATVSQGARWKVLGGLALIALSGAAMIPLAYPPSNQTSWILLIAVKSALLAAAVILFCYASCRLWPRRIFASGDEAEIIRRKFKLVAICMICIAAMAMVLGLLTQQA
jgi:uncharacterized membrane protein